MDFLLDQLRLLGLNDREVRVFTALATFGQMNMTKTAARAGLPRTTVDAIVRRLQEQGLVVVVPVKNRHEYHVDLSKLSAQLASLQCRLLPNADPGGTNAVLGDRRDLPEVARSGIDLSVYRGDRARGLVVRGGSDVDGTVARLVRLHTLAVQHGLLLETLVCRGLMYAARTAMSSAFSPTDLAGHYLHVVPESYCEGGYDLVILRDVAVFYALSDDSVASVVNEPYVVHALTHLSSVASETGWRIDLSHWI